MTITLTPEFAQPMLRKVAPGGHESVGTFVSEAAHRLIGQESKIERGACFVPDRGLKRLSAERGRSGVRE